MPAAQASSIDQVTTTTPAAAAATATTTTTPTGLYSGSYSAATIGKFTSPSANSPSLESFVSFSVTSSASPSASPPFPELCALHLAAAAAAAAAAAPFTWSCLPASRQDHLAAGDREARLVMEYIPKLSHIVLKARVPPAPHAIIDPQGLHYDTEEVRPPLPVSSPQRGTPSNCPLPSYRLPLMTQVGSRRWSPSLRLGGQGVFLLLMSFSASHRAQ